MVKRLLPPLAAFLLFFLLPVAVCAQHKTIVHKKGRVSITGTAVDLKAGAAVQDSTGIYYLFDTHSWKELEGKQVRVSGKLEIVETLLDPDEAIPQFVQYMNVIRKPEYTVIE